MKPSSNLLLRLYIAGLSPTSTLAIENLKALLTSCIHELELIDVMADPDRALEDGICVTPTLIRIWPLPQITIIGSLAQGAAVCQALNLSPGR
jgi:circadian clock protein KaiB